MQITKAEVHPLELRLDRSVQMAGIPPISEITVIFARLETRQGRSAWGCTLAHPDLTGIDPENAIQACRSYAAMVPDLHPTNIEYSLTQPSALALAAHHHADGFSVKVASCGGRCPGLPVSGAGDQLQANLDRRRHRSRGGFLLTESLKMAEIMIK